VTAPRLAFACLLAIGCSASPEARTAKAPGSIPTSKPVALVTDGGTPIAGIVPETTPASNARFGTPAEVGTNGRLKGIRRSRIAVTEIDYEALPILKPTESKSAPGVRLDPDKIVVQGDLLGEIEIGSFFASTAGYYQTSNAPRCGGTSEGFMEARWSGIVGRSWRDDRVGVLSATGLFDRRSCEATSARAGTVDAKAIVPGYVYAYRESAPSDVTPSESMVVILPHSAEVSLTAGPDRGEALRTSGYTRVTMPVERGSGRGFVARLSPESFDSWKRLRATRSAVKDSVVPQPGPNGEQVWPLLVGMEVTWEGDRRRATLQVSLADGAKKQAYAAFLRAAKVDP
jgi:hypothetical protein